MFKISHLLYIFLGVCLVALITTAYGDSYYFSVGYSDTSYADNYYTHLYYNQRDYAIDRGYVVTDYIDKPSTTSYTVVNRAYVQPATAYVAYTGTGYYVPGTNRYVRNYYAQPVAYVQPAYVGYGPVAVAYRYTSTIDNPFSVTN
jgi:hypothetical protein